MRSPSLDASLRLSVNVATPTQVKAELDDATLVSNGETTVDDGSLQLTDDLTWTPRGDADLGKTNHGRRTQGVHDQLIVE